MTENNPMQDLRCGAKTRSGKPCQNYKVTDGHGGYRKRCRMHGSADGSGAPLLNSNSRKHGKYTKIAKEQRKEVKTMIQDMTEFLRKITK